jgi:hypothetical protein
MTPQVIYLDQEDDLVSIRDRLNWTTQKRVVLVLPDRGDLLTNYLDLSLVGRHAEKLQIAVGLVTVDSRVSNRAKELGIPTFRTVEDSEKNRRRWWRGKQARIIPGKPKLLADADRREVQRRSRERKSWQQWLIRFGAITVYILTLAALFVATVYAVPAATITLKPKVRDLSVTKRIVADPHLESANFSGSSAPGRRLVSIREWQAEVETTGQVEVADSPARGTVLFINELVQPVTVPAGTRVSTSTGNRVVFQTEKVVEVPGAIGASAEADIVAIEPGPDGNVRTSLINRIEGPLALQLAVRNLSVTSGGESRTEKSVTELDIERLRAQVIQQLQVMALGDIENMLAPTEFLAKDSLRLVNIYHETYSHFPGEQSNTVALDIRAELQATAVDETQAAAFAYDHLTEAVLPGYELVPGSLHFESGEVLGADADGRVIFEMIGQSKMAAKLDLENEIDQIVGQQVGLAKTYLFERLPLSDYPTVRIWPNWFGRIPYLPVRITTEIDTSGE